MREFSFDQLIERDEAEKVACTYCGAKAGERCRKDTFRGDTRPVENITAHLSRLNRSKRAKAAEPQQKCTHMEMTLTREPGRMNKLTCDACGHIEWEIAK